MLKTPRLQNIGIIIKNITLKCWQLIFQSNIGEGEQIKYVIVILGGNSYLHTSTGASLNFAKLDDPIFNNTLIYRNLTSDCQQLS